MCSRFWEKKQWNLADIVHCFPNVSPHRKGLGEFKDFPYCSFWPKFARFKSYTYIIFIRYANSLLISKGSRKHTLSLVNQILLYPLLFTEVQFPFNLIQGFGVFLPEPKICRMVFRMVSPSTTDEGGIVAITYTIPFIGRGMELGLQDYFCVHFLI